MKIKCRNCEGFENKQGPCTKNAFQNCRNVVCYAQIPDFEVDVMPSTYAHFCFGREVLAALPQEMQSLLWPEQNLFSIGLHGPDILFFDDG